MRFSLLATLLVLGGCTASAPSIQVVVNPYEKVDWHNHQRHHGNFHTHTTESDGRESPAVVIDRYREIGHDILALTDHNKASWPWSRFGRDPEQLGMVAIPGNELSRSDHTLSLFTDLETPSKDHEQSIEEVAKAGGITVLAHPGRYWKLIDRKVPAEVRDRYVGLYTKHDTLVAMEVVNQGDRYPRDRALWDAVLTELMPGRPVWGMANDDSHRNEHIGLNATVLLLPEHSSEAVREAIETGRFYFTTVTSHPKEQRDRDGVPVIHDIELNARTGTITVQADCKGQPLADEAFHWITADGVIAHKGPTLNLADATELRRYVRVEIRGIGGTAYTQPFGLSERE